MREVLRMVDSPEIFVVPNFISEGYFTQEVIPRELGLQGKTSWLPPLRPDGPVRQVHYCEPVGLHPSMTKLLLARAEEVAPGVPRHESALIIVGHGTGLNENSTKAIKDQVEMIRQSGAGFAEVLDAYMEEPPLVAEWDQLTTAPNVIVVPFFIADGLHSFQDIPVLLGIESEITAAASQMEVFRQNPHSLKGRQLYYSSAIGTEPMLADVILDQVTAFASNQEPADPATPAARSLPEAVLDWVGEGGNRIGQVMIRKEEVGWRLFHVEDSVLAGTGQLTLSLHPESARQIARLDAAGEFRPLKTAPNLVRGWEIYLTQAEALLEALDSIYPAAVANWFRFQDGAITAATLQESLGRQTGMYRITGLLREEEAQELTEQVCSGHKCLRRILWTWDGSGTWHRLPPEKLCTPGAPAESPVPVLPVLCTDPCPLFVGAARTLVKDRIKREKEAALPSPQSALPV